LASGNGLWFISPGGWSGKAGLHKIKITKIAQAFQWKPSQSGKIFGQQFASFSDAVSKAFGGLGFRSA
jgi:hypothetical protein